MGVSVKSKPRNGKRRKPLNIGYGNLISPERIISIVHYRSSPIKKLVAEQERNQMVIDATRGKLVKSVIILETNHLLLSSLAVEQLGVMWEIC